MSDIAFEKGLPVNIDAERYVLAAVLEGRAALDLVSATLTPDDFSLEINRRVYRRMSEIFDRGEDINRLSVYEELRKQNQSESDTMGFLADLGVNAEVGACTLDSWVSIVKDKSILRQGVFFGQKFVDRCMMGTDGAVDLIQEAEAVISKIGDGAQRKVRLRTPEQIKNDYGLNDFFYPDSNKRRYVPVPWPELATLLHGWKPKELVIIAARPGVGKSACASQITMHAAEHGKGVALFSLEMAAEEILVRMACQRARLNSWRYHEGIFTRSEQDEFCRVNHEIDKWGRIWIDDSTGCTLPAIHSSVRRLRASHQVDLVVIDYLTLMEATGKHENRVQEVTAITRGLKRMAREFNLPVIVLAQLNRAAMKDNMEPELHHLRESGSIEQDADVVMFLHSAKSELAEPVTDVDFLVKKARNGPIGRRRLSFVRAYTLFESKEENGRQSSFA